MCEYGAGVPEHISETVLSAGGCRRALRAHANICQATVQGVKAMPSSSLPSPLASPISSHLSSFLSPLLSSALISALLSSALCFSLLAYPLLPSSMSHVLLSALFLISLDASDSRQWLFFFSSRIAIETHTPQTSLRCVSPSLPPSPRRSRMTQNHGNCSSMSRAVSDLSG